jgi:hypothetical protein
VHLFLGWDFRSRMPRWRTLTAPSWPSGCCCGGIPSPTIWRGPRKLTSRDGPVATREPCGEHLSLSRRLVYCPSSLKAVCRTEYLFIVPSPSLPASVLAWNDGAAFGHQAHYECVHRSQIARRTRRPRRPPCAVARQLSQSGGKRTLPWRPARMGTGPPRRRRRERLHYMLAQNPDNRGTMPSIAGNPNNCDFPPTLALNGSSDKKKDSLTIPVSESSSRGDRIRTCDLLNPIQGVTGPNIARASRFTAYESHASHILHSGPYKIHRFQGISCSFLHSSLRQLYSLELGWEHSPQPFLNKASGAILQ